MWQKNLVGEFLFVVSFESNEYLRKATACLIKNLKFNSEKKKKKKTKQAINKNS